jgi:hypothetical protein
MNYTGGETEAAARSNVRKIALAFMGEGRYSADVRIAVAEVFIANERLDSTAPTERTSLNGEDILEIYVSLFEAYNPLARAFEAAIIGFRNEQDNNIREVRKSFIERMETLKRELEGLRMKVAGE